MINSLEHVGLGKLPVEMRPFLLAELDNLHNALKFQFECLSQSELPVCLDRN